jgi:branched-chain amino acid aminotransferase
VNKISYMGKDILVPVEEDGLGPVARAMWTEITGRQIGRIPSAWTVNVAE